jgi:nucleoside-diphosphate-sugar epimerase
MRRNAPVWKSWSFSARAVFIRGFLQIAGIKLCQAYRREFGFNAICLMPANLYGPGDNFNLDNSHALPALLRRFHEAKVRGDERVIAWGTGSPRREFVHVFDKITALGWRPQISLRSGIEQVYAWFRANANSLRL